MGTHHRPRSWMVVCRQSCRYYHFWGTYQQGDSVYCSQVYREERRPWTRMHPPIFLEAQRLHLWNGSRHQLMPTKWYYKILCNCGNYLQSSLWAFYSNMVSIDGTDTVGEIPFFFITVGDFLPLLRRVWKWHPFGHQIFDDGKTNSWYIISRIVPLLTRNWYIRLLKLSPVATYRRKIASCSPGDTGARKFVVFSVIFGRRLSNKYWNVSTFIRRYFR